jgi:L-asparagine oxygenase
MIMKTTKVYVKTLSNGERALIENALENIIYPENDYRAYLSEIRIARNSVASILSDIAERANLSRCYPHYTGAIKIENLPTDRNPPMPPAQPGGLKRIEKPSWVSENVLLLIATQFGQPYSMACEGRGLVNNLIPTRATSADLSGAGAASDLRFHIENSALRFLTGRDCAPKALFLTGVRQDKAPPRTRLSDARPALDLLSPEDRKALSTAQYQIRLPYRWRQFRQGYDAVTTPRIPLLRWSPAGLLVNAALYGDMIADFGSGAGERAARNFESALEAVAIDQVVTPGEVLCIDNRSTLHARTPFDASFDTEGRAMRWAQRVFVTEDLRNFRDWDATDGAVFAPRFAAPVEELRRAG